jgi:hypothetical protein
MLHNLSGDKMNALEQSTVEADGFNAFDNLVAYDDFRPVCALTARTSPEFNKADFVLVRRIFDREVSRIFHMKKIDMKSDPSSKIVSAGLLPNLRLDSSGMIRG